MEFERKNFPDLARITLGVLFIGILIAASFWILRPFLLPLLWATMIVIATWPQLLGVQKRLGGKRSPAVAVMTVALLLVFFIPFILGIATIAQYADQFQAWAKSLANFSLPPLPGWIERLPAVGPRLSEGWQELTAAGPKGLAAQVSPYVSTVIGWLIAQAGSVGLLFVEFLLTVLLAAILYAGGETAADGVLRFFRRLAGTRGEDAAVLAARTIRGVALGVVGTALVQSVLGGIGLAVAGIPAAVVLTVAMFVLAIAQVGVFPVLLVAVGWLYWKDQHLVASLLLVWSLVVGTLDNFLRPMLIKKGADLPLLLIFAGVIGGLIAFGIIGLFIGPVVLAVCYTLIAAWIEGGEQSTGQGEISEAEGKVGRN